MDSFDTLMEKGQYNLIIKATENATDAHSLIYRIAAFTSLEQFDDALMVIEDNREVLETDALAILIMIHVDVLLLKGDTLGAFNLAKYYAELPYHSQEVEEAIKDIPNRISEFHKKLREDAGKNITDEQIIKLLESDVYEDVLSGIDYLKDRDVKDYIVYLQNIMLNFSSQPLRTLALLTLVEQKYDQEVSFKSHRGVITINPAEAVPPFGQQNFNNICFEFEKEKDVTLANIMENNLACLVINYYPDEISPDDDLTLSAIRIIALKTLNQVANLDIYCNSYGFDRLDLENKILEIESILNGF